MNKLMVAVYAALLVCPFLAIAITAPFVYYQYIKNRMINVTRSVCFYLMICFTLGAYFMTMLPFPSMEIVAGMDSPWVQLIPFYCIYDFFANSGIVISDWKTVFPALGSGIFLGIMFNIIMLMPAGYFIKRLYDMRMKKLILIAFSISLLFELTQLSGLFFIYPRPYRIFDIDDLIQNTAGAVLGAYIANIVYRYTKNIDKKIRKGGEVSFRRRVTADIIDQAIIISLFFIFERFSKRNINYFIHHPFKSFPIYFGIMISLNLVLGIILFCTNGKTLGYSIRGLKLRSQSGDKLSLLQCLIRNGIQAIYINLPLLIGWFISLSANRKIITKVICTFFSAVLVFAYVLVNLRIVLYVITHGESLFSERISKTHLGIEAGRTIRDRQKVIFRNRLIPENIEEVSKHILSILLNEGVDRKDAVRIRYASESVLIGWMENGLKGKPVAVKIDRRHSEKTLLILVLGPETSLDKDKNGMVDVLEDMEMSYDAYYSGNFNVIAIEMT